MGLLWGTSIKTTLNQVPLEFDLDEGRFSFYGLEAGSFWLNPSLYRMLAPLIEESGIELARLLIASESSKGTEEDYSFMVTQLGPTFSEGFLAWGRAVGVAGWGAFELPMLDTQNKRATVIVRNAWELKAQAGMPVRWGCPFLQGKIIGIFRHALGTNCWADERIADETGHTVEFSIYASQATISGEIERLRQAHLAQRQAELTQLERQLHEKQQTILQLSTPVVRLWDGILLLPLVGQFDSTRAAQLMSDVREAVTTSRASELIIDITGVLFVDSSVANSLLKTVQAARLLGVECMLVGIKAEVAQALVHLGADLGAVRTFSSLEAGLNQALARQHFRIVRSERGEPGELPSRRGR
jgi:rsbT co-antagonist protein RsbR